MSRTDRGSDSVNRPPATAERATPATDSFIASGVPWREDGWRSPFDLLTLAAIAGAFWLVVGLPGLAAAATLVVAWALVPPVAVFAGGTIALVAVVPAGSPPELLAVAMLALAGLLVQTPRTGRRVRPVLVLVGLWGILGAVAAVTFALTESVWLAGLTLLLAGLAGFVSLDLMSLSRLGASDE